MRPMNSASAPNAGTAGTTTQKNHCSTTKITPGHSRSGRRVVDSWFIGKTISGRQRRSPDASHLLRPERLQDVDA